MNIRAVILCTAVVFGFLVVLVRLGGLMLLDHEALTQRAQSQYRGERDVLAQRGGIFDRRGRALAVNLDVMSAFANPREIKSPGKVAKALTVATGADYQEMLSKVSSSRNFVWLQRKMDSDRAERLRGLEIRGLGVLNEIKRYYPKGSLASHVIGFVGIDNQALEGLEYQYDDTLEGHSGKVSVMVDASGRTMFDGEVPETGGSSLRLTLDESLQFIVEDALDGAMKTWNASSASAVMMNPYTGEILAMANKPDYDLNAPGDFKVAQRRNRALTDTYEPGSTFKVVAASAALEEGIAGPNTEFDVSAGSIEVGGMVVRDVEHDLGVLSLWEVIQASSNVGTIMVGQMVGEDIFYDYAGRFGFGARTGIDLPGEAPGVLRPPAKWSGTSLAALSIGYEVAVTPMQILRAYSVIANGGYLVKPHLVSEVISPEGETLYSFRPGRGKRVLSAETADILREILVSVTHEGGTARSASVDGNRVAGKTGTTRLIDPETGKYSTEKYVGSFVGFVPADRPIIALVVVVREPQGQFYGGLVAAPVFRDIAEKALAYLNIPREDTFKDNMLLVSTDGFN